MNNTSVSTNHSEAPWEQIFITTFQFIAWGLVGTSIAIAGVFGNLISIRVLGSKRMRTSTSVYLIALAVADIILLISFVVVFSLPVAVTALAHGLLASGSTLVKLIYPISLTAHTFTVYITVAFTVERYVAIRWPIKASRWCTPQQTKRYVAWIIVLSVIYNIPRMLESVVVSSQPIANLTSAMPIVSYNNSSTIVMKSKSGTNMEEISLGQLTFYRQIYHMYMYTIFMFVLPFVLLSVLNLLLLKTVRESKRHIPGGTEVTSKPHTTTASKRLITAATSQRRHRDANLTIMLMSIVLVFLVCQALPMVDNLLNVFWPHNLTNTMGYTLFYIVTQVMVVLNSAVNFIMYCCFGRKFRAILCLIFCSSRQSTNGARGISQGIANTERPSRISECRLEESSKNIEMCSLSGMNNHRNKSNVYDPTCYTPITPTCHLIVKHSPSKSNHLLKP